MKEKRINEIKGVILFAVGLIVFASLISFTPFDLGFITTHPNIPAKNFIRTFGAYLAGLLFFLFGWSSYVIPVLVFFVAVKLFKQEKPDLRLPRFVGILVLLLSLSSLVATFSLKNAAMKFSHAGFLGFAISGFMTNYFGNLGASVLFITLIILSIALVTDILISTFFSSIINRAKSIFKALFKFKLKPRIKERQAAEPVRPQRNPPQELSVKLKTTADAFPKPAAALKPNIQIKPTKLQAAPSAEAKVSRRN